MNLMEFKEAYITDLTRGLWELRVEVLQAALDLITQCRDRGGTVWLCGNGGSAALASHMATDLQLAGVRAIALTDVAAITTYANDISYDNIFASQLEILARPGDLLIAISGSGNSENILKAIDWAGVKGLGRLLIIGKYGGLMNMYVDACRVYLPTEDMGPAQDLHQIALHILCYYLMQQLKESD